MSSRFCTTDIGDIPFIFLRSTLTPTLALAISDPVPTFVKVSIFVNRAVINPVILLCAIAPTEKSIVVAVGVKTISGFPNNDLNGKSSPTLARAKPAPPPYI